MCLCVNVSEAKEVESAFRKIKEPFGHADILVNNIGVHAGKDDGATKAQDPEPWWSNFEVNGKGTFLITRSFIRLLPSRDISATLISDQCYQCRRLVSDTFLERLVYLKALEPPANPFRGPGTFQHHRYCATSRDACH